MNEATDTRLVVVALGGNAIQRPEGDDSVASDFKTTSRTARQLVRLVPAGWRLVVTHGNGPQVGNHLLRSELGHVHGGLPLLPLEVCVADTQGGMGYMLQQCLSNAFHDEGIPAVVVSVVTQVLVDAEDPAFEDPSKPVGEIIKGDRVDLLRAQGWALAEDRKRGGWRRIVPSPDPTEIVEGGAIRTLVDDGAIVIATGGGGVPVAQASSGDLRGVPAVVDKDLASGLLAVDLDADALLILTDVEQVALEFGSRNERPIEEMSVDQARAHLEAGEFPPGSMGPKVEALCRFAIATGRAGVVTSIERALDGLEGRAGTMIAP